MKALALLLLASPMLAQFPAPSRPVASIVSPTWSDDASRDAGHEVDTVIARLHLGDTTTVADIGAGNGYYTLRLAPHVRRVYAEDIMPEYLAQLRARVDSAHLGDVNVIQGVPDDPKLPPASIDVALLVHMYHEIQQPFALLEHIYPALKPGGRLVIIDLDRATLLHGTPIELLECELDAVGYREKSYGPLGRAYLAVFTSTGVTPANQIQRKLAEGGCGTASK
jgi:ubiquinone/menaquinone biosynthesis C-methylase UbiE